MESLSLTLTPPVSGEAGANSLMQLHNRFYKLGQRFKEKVCDDCSWSVPTYYRKIKGGNEYVSNAEQSQISLVEKECISYLMAHAGMLSADTPEK